MIGSVATTPIEQATRQESDRLTSRTCVRLRARVTELEARSLELVDAIEKDCECGEPIPGREAYFRLRSVLGLPAQP